ncbi:MAG: helix-turn-helix transcriptional regulator, partial [Ruminiclostridium sp.]
WYIKEFNKLLSIPIELKKQSPLIQNVLKYIHENYMYSINPNCVALTFGMNGTYLGQKFKKETGLTFLEYLTNYRVEVAKILLKSGKYKVYEVSDKVGYKTSQYFSSIFKDVTGVTPLDFR